MSPEETFRGDEWVFVVYFLLVKGWCPLSLRLCGCHEEERKGSSGKSGKLSKDNIKPSWELHRLEADFSGQFGDYLLFQQLVKSSKGLE